MRLTQNFKVEERQKYLSGISANINLKVEKFRFLLTNIPANNSVYVYYDYLFTLRLNIIAGESLPICQSEKQFLILGLHVDLHVKKTKAFELRHIKYKTKLNNSSK